jgi:hypothetical protein
MLETAREVRPRMTRRQGVEWLNNVHGIRLTWSHFNKLCMRGEGPPVDEYFGKQELRKPETFLNWALSRLRPGKTKAAA